MFLPEVVQENFKVLNQYSSKSKKYKIWLKNCKILLAGYLDSISEAVRNTALNKNKPKSSQSGRKNNDSDQDDEEACNVKQDSVTIFTQKLVSGELTEQLMK